MTDVVNLRIARKRAKRQSDEQQAHAQRLAHGRPKQARAVDAANRDRQNRSLDGHKITTGERP